MSKNKGRTRSIAILSLEGESLSWRNKLRRSTLDGENNEKFEVCTTQLLVKKIKNKKIFPSNEIEKSIHSKYSVNAEAQ